MLYFIELIHVYGCNLEYIVNWMPRNFTIANFGHWVSKSWLIPCMVCTVCFLVKMIRFGWIFNKKQLYNPRGIVVSNLQACSFNNLLTHISIVIYVWYIVNQISKVQLKYHHSQNYMVKSFKSFFVHAHFTSITSTSPVHGVAFYFPTMSLCILLLSWDSGATNIVRPCDTQHYQLDSCDIILLILNLWLWDLSCNYRLCFLWFWQYSLKVMPPLLYLHFEVAPLCTFFSLHIMKLYSFSLVLDITSS